MEGQWKVCLKFLKIYYKYENLFSKVWIILKFSFDCNCKSSILREHEEKIGIIFSKLIFLLTQKSSVKC